MVNTMRERGINGLTGESETETAERATDGEQATPLPKDQPDAAGLLDRMAEQLGRHARAATIYGDPIDRDGVTIIPVARAMWGFGGGAGHDAAAQAGSGGGGGASISPVGYIEIKHGVSAYRPITNPPVGVMATVAGLVIGLALGRLLGRREARPGGGSRWAPGRAHTPASLRAPSWLPITRQSWRPSRAPSAPWIGLSALRARLGRR